MKASLFIELQGLVNEWRSVAELVNSEDYARALEACATELSDVIKAYVITRTITPTGEQHE